MARGTTVGWRPEGVCERKPGSTSDGANGGVPEKKSGWEDEPVCHSWAKISPPSAWTESVTANHALT